ncbi:meiotically up-regulated gene 184 protein [Neltuma alba]|uniref:meiotically up-regulated gene 184 protein n=1 Tax=Neltuma alba TaxID=207710 RepID=UPI0010A53415|nr:meiotically up-regulated gene 184 protein [Prosopis alba]XP_028796443.1 meiotically up-regulated gene 184 protein [Prosopis alba]XP_028796444.1 meiotically up-regulated gene 184 protein [Prosopis alba]XP_028796445.1 meiotically up-regulated gene 184 protein [Prosopis alba]
MECNKDEATRAKEIAERKFVAKDMRGAKKFALKAQTLFPELEGISQMLATLDVYISADNKINGEADWYGILGADPRADDETIRKQYRKLALTLHPDKNKSIGADGAFKFISEAWSLLSDKAKKVAYDQKRNTKVQKVSTKSSGASAHQGTNGNFNFAKTTTSSARAHKHTTKPDSTSTHKSKSNTFWTVCNRCKMQYEYLRVYLNLKLLCPNCHGAFLAVETSPPPASGVRPATSFNFSRQQQNFNNPAPSKSKSKAGKNKPTSNVGAGYGNTDSYNHTDFQWAPFSKTSGVSTAAQAASVVQQAYEKVKREREEAQAATKREQALRRKQHASKKGNMNPTKRRRGMEDSGASSHGKEPSNQAGMRNGVVGAGSSCGSKPGNFDRFSINGSLKTSGAGTSELELNNLLMVRARKEIGEKLKDIQSNTISKRAMTESRNGSETENEKGEKVICSSERCDQNNLCNSNNRNSEFHATEISAGTTSANVDMKTMTIDIPDPDFHDFDQDRTDRSFGENQVWVAYDDDGMPRIYAMIHSVISSSPLKMQISWLNSKTNDELAPLNWIISGFSKTCGEFRMGRNEINNSLNSFSHKVRWRKGAHGAICIYPMKGDVWALYRNWSPDWNELTADEVIHKYDMVEVLEDFSEENGVMVIPLVKVAGFKTLFRRHLDPGEIRIIPREEMFRFSHQVPSYLHRGKETPDIVRGCWELDPAATPSELLEVIKAVEEEEIVGEEGSPIKETTNDDIKRPNDEEMINDTGKFGNEREKNDKGVNEIGPLEEDK